ncbi:23S rRNA (guanosine2251-2'-O)-methyltransferase [Pilibacter termitis]|uniref:23S rRNA (Guanosine2251-2'-O)-methyltransferase n=1 Tax=Pilibacter termitis TaxID=263852 RepID=A0A1T4M082_9ENTE|nr:23S rRNA (guanosine(2251)-2'-O)-methyltransferase RlmB [Pilibacter termitis]SJZ60134.1 23S rRNA (guanosine2251-2'-O)-methyltransferase [Pilibacter termitis]
MTRNKQEHEKKEIDENLLYGHHAVKEALLSGRVNKLFFVEESRGKSLDELKRIAREKKVPVKFISKQKMDSLTNGAVHQNVLVSTQPFEYLELEELLAKTDKEQAFLIVLDSLTDPHNFGSILRTSDAAGVDGVIIPKHRAVGVTPTVVKTSTGAIEHVPIARVTNLTQAMKQLKEQGYWVFGTDMKGVPYQKWQTKGKIALIIGNEGKGMSQGLKKEVDEMITIPMSETSHVQSLNASVAASLLIYEVYRNRMNG